MPQALVELAARYPPPWKIGWWRDLPEGRCGLEATRRVAYARFVRVFGSGSTWADALTDVRP